MLLRLAYLGVTNALAMLRPLPMSDRAKDAEILALRHHTHRPHRGISNARPLHPLPNPSTRLDTITHLDIRRRDRLGGILREYENAA